MNDIKARAEAATAELDEVKKYHEQMKKREICGKPIRRCYVFFQLRHIDFLLSEVDRLTEENERLKEQAKKIEAICKDMIDDHEKELGGYDFTAGRWKACIRILAALKGESI
jgi:hypothetical protein